MTTATLSNVRLTFRAPGTVPQGKIRYSIGTCSQGALLVARSSDGICAILIDDEPARLRELVVHAFPGSVLEEMSLAMYMDLAQVAAFIDQPSLGIVLDLSVGGTAFQQRVWKALCAIPTGQTRSYTEVAEAIENPDAVRAVAGACAANVLAVAIPCHRVIRNDGAIAGYRWGVDRKRSLLTQESLQEEECLQ